MLITFNASAGTSNKSYNIKTQRLIKALLVLSYKIKFVSSCGKIWKVHHANNTIFWHIVIAGYKLIFLKTTTLNDMILERELKGAIVKFVFLLII